MSIPTQEKEYRIILTPYGYRVEKLVQRYGVAKSFQNNQSVDEVVLINSEWVDISGYRANASVENFRYFDEIDQARVYIRENLINGYAVVETWYGK